MRQSTICLSIMMFIAQVYAAPQFIDIKEGRIGVNFGGYRAGVGLNGGGAGGGLYAEAGTPHGQAARAGLGGSTDGGPAGGLYAGATAGGNVNAEAGIGGSVYGGKSAGEGYASAQAGDKVAAAGLGGEKSAEGASGFKFTATKSFTGSAGPSPVQPVEFYKPAHNKQYSYDVVNEVTPPKTAERSFMPISPVPVVPQPSPAEILEKDAVYTPVTIEKHIVKTRPRHHFRKTAYLSGYFGGNNYQAVQPAPVKPLPALEKRIDLEEVPIPADAHPYSSNGGQVAYRKQISYQRNPQFFSDIFNIPISTLQAVGNFLSNTASNTKVSVQKSASVQSESPKYLSPSSSTGASESAVSIQTPTASKFIDDIFAIPINTLGAVNKFLENNVPARKQVSLLAADDMSGDATATRVRLGPHARRRANKRIVIVNEQAEQSTSTP